MHRHTTLLRTAAGLAACLAWPAATNTNAVQINYFDVSGYPAFIAMPANPGPATPWVWYAPTRTNGSPDAPNDWLFQHLLDQGIAVAGIDVGESFGSPAGRAVYSTFYTYATSQAGLNAKPCLLAQSRGGLMMYNWAAENAEKIRGIGGIFPVGDLRSYPGLATAAPAYGMTTAELQLHLAENNPIDRLAPLAAAKIPIFHIAGDSDTIVPLEANSQVIYDRYTALGGQMTLVVVPGKGHEVVPEYFESQQLLDFLTATAVPEPGAMTLLAVGLASLVSGRHRRTTA